MIALGDSGILYLKYSNLSRDLVCGLLPSPSIMLSTQIPDKVRILGEKAVVLSRYCEKYGILMIRNATHISLCDGYRYPPLASHIAHLQFDALVGMSEDEIEEYVVRCCLDSMARA